MWWNKLILACALIFHATAYTQEAKCPAYHDRTPLYGADIDDGKVDLSNETMEPDFSRGEGDNQYGYYRVEDIFDAGHVLYLVCRYGNRDSKNTVIVKVSKRVNRCSYRRHPGGRPAEFSCK
ncbi:MAG: STY0301 family protein [Terracidiphilus sp.]